MRQLNAHLLNSSNGVDAVSEKTIKVPDLFEGTSNTFLAYIKYFNRILVDAYIYLMFRLTFNQSDRQILQFFFFIKL